MIVLYILIFILVLGVLICFHEFGHYFFAKKFGVQVDEFAFGMGPKLLSKKKGETYWSIRALPIGGFCAMAGEDEAASILKEGDEVKLVLNDLGKVSKIILKVKDEEYNDLPLVTVEKFDLLGKDMAPLYINEYEVERDAILYYSKKNEIQISPYEKTFFSKNVWKKLLICLGGPLNNFILGFVIFILLGLLTGIPSNVSTIGAASGPAQIAGLNAGDKILSIDGIEVDENNAFSSEQVEGTISYAVYKSLDRELTVEYERNGEVLIAKLYATYAFNNLGISSYTDDITEENAEVVRVIVETPAALGGTNKTMAYQAKGGLRNGDIITKINYYGDSELVIKESKDINSWADLYAFATSDIVLSGGNVSIEYIRDGEAHSTDPYKIYSNELLSSQGYTAAQKVIGVSASTKFHFGYGLLNGLKYFGKAAGTIFSTLWLLFTSKEVGLNSLGGFITILNQTATYSAAGILNLLYFVGLLSVNLGIVNLLPIPALDGGRILFLFIEGITGKKINPKVESIIINVVFILLMLLIGYILVQDVIRLVIQLR